MSSDTTHISRLPDLTLTQRRAVQRMQQARKQADAESKRTITRLRAPSSVTLREPVRRRRDVMLLPTIDPQPTISVAAGWPQWMLGLVLLMLLFVGAALMSMAHDTRGNVEATTGWTDTPLLQ
jgi:hypothetical protein